MHRQGEQEQKLSLASQAYKLFSERKTLAQVATNAKLLCEFYQYSFTGHFR
jgi:transcriptional regulator of met regulon